MGATSHSTFGGVPCQRCIHGRRVGAPSFSCCPYSMATSLVLPLRRRRLRWGSGMVATAVSPGARSGHLTARNAASCSKLIRRAAPIHPAVDSSSLLVSMSDVRRATTAAAGGARCSGASPSVPGAAAHGVGPNRDVLMPFKLATAPTVVAGAPTWELSGAYPFGPPVCAAAPAPAPPAPAPAPAPTL